MFARSCFPYLRMKSEGGASNSSPLRGARGAWVSRRRIGWHPERGAIPSSDGGAPSRDRAAPPGDGGASSADGEAPPVEFGFRRGTEPLRRATEELCREIELLHRATEELRHRTEGLRRQNLASVAGRSSADLVPANQRRISSTAGGNTANDKQIPAMKFLSAAP
jgi:hypothetical protein